MISIHKVTTEMDRQEKLLQALLRCYSQAISSSAECAVEFDDRATREFRERLTSLHRRTNDASDPHDYEEVDKALRKELQSYHDAARDSLKKMRRELENATSAMRGFAEDMSTSSSAYEVTLKEEVQRLKGLSRCPDDQEIRKGLESSAEQILHSYEHLQRSHQLTIVQLRDEIRALHQAMDRDKQSQLTDHASGAWNRIKIAERMDALQERNERFCTMVVVVRNWRRLQSKHSRSALNAVLQNFLKDLRAILGADGIVGRWSDDVFVALLEIGPAAAMGISNEVKRKLPSAYSVRDETAMLTISLETVAGIVDRQLDVAPARFNQKLQQLMEALVR